MSTSSSIHLEVSLVLNHSASTVWKGLTDKELVKKYFFGTELTTAWETGSPITFSGTWDGKPYEDKGIILELVPDKLLKYNYWSSFSGLEDIPENYVNITYRLTDNGNHTTTLTILQDGFKNEEAKNHSVNNWKMILDNLSKVLTENFSN
jgi:uncharacterized protein YndB with AHSA1/START domain